MAKEYTTKEMRPSDDKGTKKVFNFPTLGVSVEAYTLEEALKLAKAKKANITNNN